MELRAITNERREPLAPLFRDALLAPRRGFRAVLRRRGVADAAAALVLYFVAISSLVACVTSQGVRRLLECGAPASVRARAESDARNLQWRAFVKEPAQMATRAAGSTLALEAVGAAFGRAPPIAAAWRIALLAEVPEALGRLADVETLFRCGPEVSLDLRPLVGRASSLAEFASFESSNCFAEALAERATPFFVWSMTLVGIGARELVGRRGATAAGAFVAGAVHLALAGAAAAMSGIRSPG